MLNMHCISRSTDRLAKLKRAVENSRIEVLVGFPSGMTHIETTHDIDPETGKRTTGTRDGGDMADLAEKLHFGTAEIPARPFIEDGLEMNRAEIKKAFKKELERIKDTGRANLDRLGVLAVSKVKELVRSGYYKGTVPNAPLTIKLKGSDTPLIDGANMIESLCYVKVQNGSVSGPVKAEGS